MNLQTSIELQASIHKSPRLMVMVGLPGSGKTTKSKELAAQYPDALLLSRDDIRGQMQFASESKLTKHLWHAADLALAIGKDVIVDSPNLDKNDKPTWERIATKHKAKLQYLHMDAPFGVVVNRDAERQHPVGADKIKSMLQAGGAGSGCHGPNCGRPSTGGHDKSTSEKKSKDLSPAKAKAWAKRTGLDPKLARWGKTVYKSAKAFASKYGKPPSSKKHGYFLAEYVDYNKQCCEKALNILRDCDDPKCMKDAEKSQPVIGVYRAAGLTVTDIEQLSEAVDHWTSHPTKEMRSAISEIQKGNPHSNLAKALFVQKMITYHSLKNQGFSGGVKLYRGVTGSFAKQLLSSKKLTCRPGESWSESKVEAEEFAESFSSSKGAIMSVKVPLNNIYLSWRTNSEFSEFSEEKEFVVSFPGNKYKLSDKEIHPYDNNSDLDAAADSDWVDLGADPVHDNWLHSMRKKKIKADVGGEPEVGNYSQHNRHEQKDWFKPKPGKKGGVQAGGPGSGCNPAAGQCGRHPDSKLIMGDNTPSKDKPVVLVFGGSFNPPHTGHVETAEKAAEMLKHAGYNVSKIVIAPTADKLLKAKLGERMYPLSERTKLSKMTFPANMEVNPKPAEEAEQTEGKLRRTQLADSIQKQHPNATVVNVTGEDAAPGHPPGFPSLYEGDGNHKGYYYMAIDRPATSLSSGKIRLQLHENKPVEGMTPKAESYLRQYLKSNPHIKLVAASRSRRLSAGGKGSGCNPDVGKCGRPAGGGKETTDHKATVRDQQRRISRVLNTMQHDPKVKAAEERAATLGDSRYTDGIMENGQYTASADTENNAIAQLFLNPKSKPAPGEAPTAIFILGKPGSGKTTMVRGMGEEFPETTMINSDDIKEKIGGYSPETAAAYHERSCDIARSYLTSMAVGQGYNVTFDMTDNADRLLKTMQMLKDGGYKVGVLLAHVDSATSVERVYSRFLKTGRYVPPNVVLSYGDKPERAYEKAKAIADEYRAYDTAKGGNKIIEQGGKSGHVFQRTQRGVGASAGRRREAGLNPEKEIGKLSTKSRIKGVGEPDVPQTGMHIEPDRLASHPPSLRNPQRVPADNPGETDDRFLDVTKRKDAIKQRLELLKHQAPAGAFPAHHGFGWTPSVYGSRQRMIQRPAKPIGAKRTHISLPKPLKDPAGSKLQAARAILQPLKTIKSAGSLISSIGIFKGVKIEGFDRQQQEEIRSVISRIPPVFLQLVQEIKKDPGLGAKHGRYYPDQHIIHLNPATLTNHQRFGRGAGWINHNELCLVHEFGHAVYSHLTEEQHQQWRDLSGWMEGTKAGQAPAYVEKRPGWESGTSNMTHKDGILFTRHYAERNDHEDFADCFAFFVLGKPKQMEPSKARFIRDIVDNASKFGQSSRKI